MKKLGLSVLGVYVYLSLAFSAQWVYAQEECGTCCPVCTGELKIDNNKTNPVIEHGKFSWFTIFEPQGHGEENEKGSSTFSIGLFNRLEGGVTIGFDSWDLRGKAKFLLLGEEKIFPAVVAGIGNIRPSGIETNGYLTLSKSFTSGLPVPISAYVGGAKPFNGENAEIIFGFSIGLGSKVGAMAAFDGKEFHLGGAVQPLNNINVGILWIGMEHPGLISSFSGKLPFIYKEPESQLENPSK